jgi:hypothetical protein
MKNKSLSNGIVFLLAMLLFINYVSAADDQKDSDLDGIADVEDRYPFDYDNDGMPDIWEKKHGLNYDANDANNDPDDDGIKNIGEYNRGTNPLVSEITNVKVKGQEVLSPVEMTLARLLIWIGIGLLLLIGIIFLLYKEHIFTMFKFMHHMSKNHAETIRSGASYRPIDNRNVPQRRAYPQRIIQRPIVRSHMQQYQQPVSKQVRQAQQPIAKRKYQKLPAQPTQQTQTKSESTIKKRVQKPNLVQIKKNIPESKEPEDVFSRLSKEVDEHKIDMDVSLERLKKIKLR